MRLFLKLGSVVLVSLVLSVGSITLFGRSLPVSDRIAILHLDVCEAPCWIGIIPRQTTITDAEKLLRDTFSAPYRVVKSSLSSDMETQFDIYLRGEPAFSVGFLHPEAETDTVMLVTLYFGDSISSKYRNYTLAELHNALGIPQYLMMNYVSSLVYEKPNGAVTVDGYNTDLDTPLQMQRARSITFYGKLNTGLQEFGFIKWKGFIPSRLYAQRICSPQC